MELELRIGQRVRRIQSWERAGMEGQPTGPELTIVNVFPGADFAICKLSDGRHEFEFNLVASAFSFAQTNARHLAAS